MIIVRSRRFISYPLYGQKTAEFLMPFWVSIYSTKCWLVIRLYITCWSLCHTNGYKYQFTTFFPCLAYVLLHVLATSSELWLLTGVALSTDGTREVASFFGIMGWSAEVFGFLCCFHLHHLQVNLASKMLCNILSVILGVTFSCLTH